jgi:adenylate kinase
LKSLLAERGADLDHVVQIDVADEEIVERLSSRRTCEKCGAIYNLKFSPPEVEGVCDKCGSDKLQLRADDVPETIRQRLSVYHDQTAPLVEYYREAGLLRSVDGSQHPKKVAEAIAAYIS